MPKPTVAEFRALAFGNSTLGATEHFEASPDAAIQAKLDRAWDSFKAREDGTILLAAHLLATELSIVQDGTTGANALDLGSGAGLVTDEMDGGTQRAQYRQANRNADPDDAHLLTTPYGRMFHYIRGRFSRRKFVAFV